MNPFIAALHRKARMLAPSAEAACAQRPELTSWLLDPLARWAETAYGDSIFDEAARGYASYCMHVGRAARRYEQEGRYTPADLEEIVTDVYGNDGVMIPYMWAAVLIYAFWPSLGDHLDLYKRFFVDALPPDPRIVELACGHGVLGLLAVEHRADVDLVGYDISPAAIAIAERLGDASGLNPRARFAVQDVLASSMAGTAGRFQGVVAAMLAEHLVDPQPLFTSIAHHLAPGGLAFVSTALESPQRDHVYEFHRESEPIAMAEAVGLRVTRLVSGSAGRRSSAKFHARSLAMVLERA